VAQLTRLFREENNPDLMLRVFVQGGGCSGFQYGFAFEDTQNDDDFEFGHGEVRVLVDAMSMQYLQGATIDFREDAMGSTFVIDNPQATTTCGCGSSFSV
jgi:iron-sulfur cluster insertion protein